MGEGLCYVDPRMGVIVAYFTDKPLTGEDKVWGDDWNDVPYEHNAGLPYDWTSRLVALDVPAQDPSDMYPSLSSQWSVQEINEDAVPWLITDQEYRRDRPRVPRELRAGATPAEFIAYVRALGGTVYAEQPDEGGA